MRQKTMLKMLGLSLLTVTALSSCVGSGDGIESAGDPNYWTSSRGQFTNVVTNSDNTTTTMYFLNNGDGTATVTFNGAYPLQQMNDLNVTLKVDTYDKSVVTIPSYATLDDGTTLTVTSIGERAFCANRNLLAVEVPSTVTSIGVGAFLLCENLTSVTFASGCQISSLGSSAFARCTENFSDIEPLMACWTNVTTTIPPYAFLNCKLLYRTVTIPSTTKKGPNETNYWMPTIPEGVTRIEKGAYYAVSSSGSFTVRTLEIPSSVTYLGHSAFGGNSRLYFVRIKATTPPEFGLIEETNTVGNPFQGDTAIKAIIVPDGSVNAYKADPNWSQWAGKIYGESDDISNI